MRNELFLADTKAYAHPFFRQRIAALAGKCCTTAAFEFLEQLERLLYKRRQLWGLRH